MKPYRFNLSLILVFIVVGCSTNQQYDGSQQEDNNQIDYASSKTSLNCTEAFLLGKNEYEKYKLLSNLDNRNFYSASIMLERAKQKCSTHEYHDDVLFTLANSYNFLGEYKKAIEAYTEITVKYPSSSYNTGLSTADEEIQFLVNCSTDPMMEIYHRARMHELHKEFTNALTHYEKLLNSDCSGIRDRATSKLRRLRYLVD